MSVFSRIGRPIRLGVAWPVGRADGSPGDGVQFSFTYGGQAFTFAGLPFTYGASQ